MFFLFDFYSFSFYWISEPSKGYCIHNKHKGYPTWTIFKWKENTVLQGQHHFFSVYTFLHFPWEFSLNCCHDAASKASSNAALKEGDPRCARILSYREVDCFCWRRSFDWRFPLTRSFLNHCFWVGAYLVCACPFLTGMVRTGIHPGKFDEWIPRKCSFQRWPLFGYPFVNFSEKISKDF